MERRFEVETRQGPIWLNGRDTGRPVLASISGAFAPADWLWRLQDFFPDADVLRAHLPGNHAPPLAETSLAAFASAFSEALEQVAAGRPMVVLGASAGALVALGLRAQGVRRLVLVEPPLLTEGVWPLEAYREETPPGGEAFVEAFFGVGRHTIEPRDHGWVLEGLQVPAHVLVGDDPLLPRRPTTRMPSLVSAASLARLRAHPLVTVELARGAGHNIPRDAGQQLHEAVVRAWRAAVGEAQA